MKTPVVRLESNGQYWAAAYTNTAGSVVRKGLGSKAKVSRREALALCQQLAFDLAENPAMAAIDAGTTLVVWLNRYRDSIVRKAQSTENNHNRTADLLIEGMGDHVRIGEITAKDAADWRVWLSKYTSGRTGRTLSDISVALHVSRAKLIFESAVSEGVIVRNPFAKIRPNVPKVASQWRYVSEAEADAMCERAPTPEYRILVLLARLAGLRRNEIERLTWDDVNWENHTLTVKAKDGRATTKQRDRITPIQPRLFAALLAKFHSHDRSQWVFVGKYSNPDKVVAKMARDAGIVEYGKPLHTLRKSLVSDWQSKYPPMDVAAWLGHSVTVAAKHYHTTLAPSLASVTGHVSQQTPTNLPQNPEVSVENIENHKAT